MTPKELKDRTKRFAVDVVQLTRELPNTVDGRRIGQQFLDCGTSVAANYRSACRARSRAEFIAKMGVVEEESDEALFWLELMVDSHLVTRQRGTADEGGGRADGNFRLVVEDGEAIIGNLTIAD